MTNYQVVLKENIEKPYAVLCKKVALEDISQEIPPLIDILLDLLKKENIKTNGDCFFRYLSCSNDGQIVVEAGIPIEKTETKSDKIEFGSFPAGKYLSVMHIGDYKNLIDAHTFLETYAKSNNLSLSENIIENGIEWGCRAEIYLTEPDITPIAEWKTEVIFLLK